MKEAELKTIRDKAVERATKVPTQSIEGRALGSLLEAIGDAERAQISYDRASSNAIRTIEEARDRFEATGEASPWLDGSLRSLQECRENLKAACDALERMIRIVG